MNYKFPNIKNILDVLPAIKDSKEFIVVEKPGYTVVNYMVVGEDTFPSMDDARINVEHNAIRRECRGIKFDSETGNIIARPYHKFFNMNEREETNQKNINEFMNVLQFSIMEKLDGSMVHPFMVNGDLRWATKMGITDTSMEAEVFIAKNPKYVDFAKIMLEANFTPIFEWESKSNPIVIQHSQDNLILTACRNLITGEYALYDDLKIFAYFWNIPVVGIMDKSIVEIETMENIEGIVVRFNSGHMIKVKASWYVLRHKSKDAIMREKNVLDYIINEKVDDVIPFLMEEDAKKLVKFQAKVMANIIEYADILQAKFELFWTLANGDRKTFALQYADVNFGHDKSMAFKIMDGNDSLDVVKKFISTNIGTQTAIENIRHIIKEEWNYDR